MISKADDLETAVCIIPSDDASELIEAARKHFGNRCVVDPEDNSDETYIKRAKDDQHAFSGRAKYGELSTTIYELWSFKNARKWCEGFKKRSGHPRLFHYT